MGGNVMKINMLIGFDSKRPNIKPAFAIGDIGMRKRVCLEWLWFYINIGIEDSRWDWD
jgi:hypothetical protein